MVEKVTTLSEEEFSALVLEIAGRLDGLSTFQIEHLLRTVSKLTAAGSHFNVNSEAFQRELARQAMEFPANGDAPGPH